MVRNFSSLLWENKSLIIKGSEKKFPTCLHSKDRAFESQDREGSFLNGHYCTKKKLPFEILMQVFKPVVEDKKCLTLGMTQSNIIFWNLRANLILNQKFK